MRGYRFDRAISCVAIMLFLILSGCGVSTSQIVNMRHQSREIRRLHDELNDSLQVSLYGMHNNADIKVRDGFREAAFLISGKPSLEEQTFAKNATLQDIDEFTNNVVTTKNNLIKLERQFEKTQQQIQDGVDSQNRFSSFSIAILGGIIALFVSIFLYFKFSL